MEKRSLPELKYIYYVELENYLAYEGLDTVFDPASVAKLYYAIYLIKHYSVTELNSGIVTITFAQIRKYGKGTRKLSYLDIGHEFSIFTLLGYMMTGSCNISTGIIADLVGRAAVNEFIRNELKLANTTILTKTTPNQTTINDLLKLLKLITTKDFLPPGKKEILFSIMGATRRAQIQQILGPLRRFQIFSKGGTTFAGARRDLAIIKTPRSYGFAIIIQLPPPTPQFSRINRIMAKIARGDLSKYLKFLDSDFRSQVKELLEPILILHRK